MSVWTTANSGGIETPAKSPAVSAIPRSSVARNLAVTTTQHQFQHVVAAAVAAATSVATGHQLQQFPNSHPLLQHHHNNNSPTGSNSNSSGFKRSSISNSLLQFPPPPPPPSSNQPKVSPITNQSSNNLFLSPKSPKSRFISSSHFHERCYGSPSHAKICPTRSYALAGGAFSTRSD